MEVVGTLPHTLHDLEGVAVIGRDGHGTARFGHGRCCGSACHLGSTLLPQLGERLFQLLAEGLLTLLCLDEPFALGERERVIALLLHRSGTFRTAAELLFYLPSRYGFPGFLHGLKVLVRILGLVFLLRGIGILAVDIADGAVVVDLPEGLRHALHLPFQPFPHGGLGEVRIQILRGLEGRIGDLRLLRVHHVDDEIPREKKGKVDKRRKDVLRLLEINLLEQFHLLQILGLVSWYAHCPGPPGWIPPESWRIRSAPCAAGKPS